MSAALYGARRVKNIVAQVLAVLATIFGLFWLVWIMWTTLSKGLGSINLALFTQMTPPPGDEGGMLNAFFGSIVMSLMGIVFGARIGVLAARPPRRPALFDSRRRPAPARLRRGLGRVPQLSAGKPLQHHIGILAFELVERRQQIRRVARAKGGRSVVDQEGPVGKARWHVTQITACDTRWGVCASGTGAHVTLGTPVSATSSITTTSPIQP